MEGLLVRFPLIHFLRAIELTLNGAFGFQFQGPVLVILLEAYTTTSSLHRRAEFSIH